MTSSPRPPTSRKPDISKKPGQHMARKGGTAYVQVLYRCSLTLMGRGASGFSHELDAGRQAEFVVDVSE